MLRIRYDSTLPRPVINPTLTRETAATRWLRFNVRRVDELIRQGDPAAIAVNARRPDSIFALARRVEAEKLASGRGLSTEQAIVCLERHALFHEWSCKWITV